MKHIHYISGRSYTTLGGRDGGNRVYLNPNSGWSSENLAGHEIGHAHNSQGINHPSDNTNADYAKSKGLGYLTGNDNELGAFLGSVRRTVYKNTNGKVDTANPEDFKKVQQKPSAYGVGDIDKEGFKDLKNLQNYKGNDQEIIKRRDELNRRLSNPQYMGQFVKNGNSKKTNIA